MTRLPCVCRRFVVDVFCKLVRLSYYGNVAGKIPEVYMQIFPPKPEPQPLEDGHQDSNGDQAMADAPASVAETSGRSLEAEKKWALQFIQQVPL